MSDLVKRLEALEAAHSDVRFKLPKTAAEWSQRIFDQLMATRHQHPELAPAGDGYWPATATNPRDIPIQNLRVLAGVSRLAKIICNAHARKLRADGADLL
jgi:hypothetical protein